MLTRCKILNYCYCVHCGLTDFIWETANDVGPGPQRGARERSAEAHIEDGFGRVRPLSPRLKPGGCVPGQLVKFYMQICIFWYFLRRLEKDTIASVFSLGKAEGAKDNFLATQ